MLLEPLARQVVLRKECSAPQALYNQNGYYRVALLQLYPRQFTPQALCVSSWPLEGPSRFAFAPLHSPESTDQFDLARKKASRYRSKAGVSLDRRSPSLIPAGPLRERGLPEEEIHQ